MTPVVYQNRNGTESLWATHTVVENGATGISWYQFNVTGGNFPAAPVQQQHWTNGNDGLWRWMPSIAVDTNGNTAIGYSVSSSSIYPGIRYAGRLAADPPSNLAQGEAIMFNGFTSTQACQFVCERWGDYTMTTVDPADGTSFWHVNQVRYWGRFFILGLSHRKVQFPGTHSNGISDSYFNANCDCISYIYSNADPGGDGDGNRYSNGYIHAYAYADANGKLQLHIHHWNGRVCARRC